MRASFTIEKIWSKMSNQVLLPHENPSQRGRIRFDLRAYNQPMNNGLSRLVGLLLGIKSRQYWKGPGISIGKDRRTARRAYGGRRLGCRRLRPFKGIFFLFRALVKVVKKGKWASSCCSLGFLVALGLFYLGVKKGFKLKCKLSKLV